MTTFSDMVFDLGGVPVNGMFTNGKPIFVKPSSGDDNLDGRNIKYAVKTLTRALALATENNNDVVYMIAESNSASGTTDYQSEALDWNKDGVHLIGINCMPFIGSRSRIAQLSTVKTIENLFTVSANNCLIANIAIFQGVASSTATSPVAVNVTGERNMFLNCQMQGIGDTSMDTAGARSLIVTGSENTFKECYIGLDTVIRSTATTETEIANARNFFIDCDIVSYTDLSTFKALTTSSSVTGRDVALYNCKLRAVQNITSAVAPTGAIAHSEAGQVLLHYSAVYGYANVCTTDNSEVLVSGAAGGIVDMGLATAVDIA